MPRFAMAEARRNLTEIEDRMDVAAARKALADKSKRIPLSEIMRKYGVK